jgi:uroporphyrinogen-III synthase
MKRILITRPRSSAVALAEKISARTNNFLPVIFPAIEIIPVETDPFSTLSWPQIDYVIFISPAAVESAARFITSFPAHITLFATGADSAAKVRALSLGRALFPYPVFNSEALLNLKELENPAHQTIVICKGAGGNSLLFETLSKRKAKVVEIVLYHRCLPHPAALPDLNTIDVIISTSSESLHNLIVLFGDAVKKKQLLVSSERLKILVKSAGFELPALLAKNAGDDALIDAIIHDC